MIYTKGVLCILKYDHVQYHLLLPLHGVCCRATHYVNINTEKGTLSASLLNMVQAFIRLLVLSSTTETYFSLPTLRNKCMDKRYAP